MKLINSIRSFFSKLRNRPVEPLYSHEDEVRYAEIVEDLINKIKKINPEDNSLWQLSDLSKDDLEKKYNLDGLMSLKFKLENRLAEIDDSQSKKLFQQDVDDGSTKWKDKI